MLVKWPAGNVLIGVAFILVGVILELNARGLTHIGWEVFWPVIIILVGAHLLWHNARVVTGLGQATAASKSDYPLDLNFVFSGTDQQISDKDFKGGRINAVFGGFKLDFTHADMQSGEAILEVNLVFGGGEILVPQSWEIEIISSGVFGSVEDKTRRYAVDPSLPKRILRIKGSTVFGGLEIKN